MRKVYLRILALVLLSSSDCFLWDFFFLHTSKRVNISKTERSGIVYVVQYQNCTISTKDAEDGILSDKRKRQIRFQGQDRPASFGYISVCRTFRLFGPLDRKQQQQQHVKRGRIWRERFDWEHKECQKKSERPREHWPGDLVGAGHGDELLALQDAVPRLDGAPTSHRHRPLARLDFGPQVAAVLSHEVSAAVHCRHNTMQPQPERHRSPLCQFLLHG